MSLFLFNDVPAESIEVLFDCRSQPWLKQVDVGDFIGIKNMRDVTANFLLMKKNHALK